MRVFDFDSAIARTPGRSVVRGLRAHDAGPPSYEGILAEHAAYVDALRAAGVDVEVLPPLENHPDSMFVEDPALVFPQAAILLRPGTPTRIDEAVHLEPTLRRRFEQVLSLATGHVDGGDVLVTPARVYIGISARTDAAGAQALVGLLDGLGYPAQVVPTPPGTLHLKTAASLVDDETLLATRALAAADLFDGMRILVVPDGEENGANVLRVNRVVLAGAAYPRTLELLAGQGLDVVALPVTEAGKIDAGLSCMSLRWASRRR